MSDKITTEFLDELETFIRSLDERTIKVCYKNWRGEVRTRDVMPVKIHWGSSHWHPEAQWLLTAINPEDGQTKQFALKDCDFRRWWTDPKEQLLPEQPVNETTDV